MKPYQLARTFLFSSLLGLSLPAFAEEVQIAPTQGSLALDYSVSIEGTGSKDVGAIHFDGDSGTIEIKGRMMESLIQERIPWAAQGLVLYQGMAFDLDHWQIFWIYCSPKQQIESVYFEGMTEPGLQLESATGTCQSTTTPQNVELRIPALDLASVQPISGFSIEGPGISLPNGGIGKIADPAFSFVPFVTVDCSGCGGSGWYELHSLFYNAGSDRACFGIIYLSKGSKEVTLDYSLCLPDLSRPLDGLALPAEWSRGLGASMSLMTRPDPLIPLSYPALRLF